SGHPISGRAPQPEGHQGADALACGSHGAGQAGQAEVQRSVRRLTMSHAMLHATAGQASAARPRRSLSGVAWGIAIAVLVVLIVWPIGKLVAVSFQDSDGVATLGNYARAFGAERFRVAAWNSLVLASSVGILSVLVAAPMAWATARTNMPGRRLIGL